MIEKRVFCFFCKGVFFSIIEAIADSKKVGIFSKTEERERVYVFQRNATPDYEVKMDII